ncbi:MAG TPA: 1-deoxy-D-xylulose-5-phosphate reductoisomerase [Hypericibacter adhaerens]|jgi:1-deoxy-D-xylulose-5-phosphate reductoisomerase|uniref:1-deoxy-D-xylulose 5-phosphate reductoisomerase n=1 Tax=Hypericibacter adhaerens TaxID=2602016 RepID=A0A5J6MT51_9PROT|nr:1-deoxy-D-xylulose-5-phosphate reductoisomerase [Hypericibacter adhaerens]QEX20519.1 1-deoxy-D-xylulose 5-phosphate reductoisomerase [Hypericibacter adhaerens]HWA42986.1 1-deoxy-D-xylulose-5-phosphate reductoisomerase [Hypericibacter adhaerens]
MSTRAARDAALKAVPSAEPRSVTILGSTGSVGRNTVDLIRRDPTAYRIEALTGSDNVALLAEQARLLKPKLAVVANPARYGELKEALAGTGTELAAGPEAVTEAAQRPAKWVMASIVGAAGLKPTLAAVRRGAVIGLANKETLVCAGALMMGEVKRHKATLLPVDSEHSAIFQVFETERREAVDRIILTASGGPFRTASREVMEKATPAQAVKHPNWSMGAKISIDSATMMNKGLEIIEAQHLFNMPEDRIEVLVHPQSVIHSMVAYVDGSVLAQLGTPDMRTPIAVALAWPKRMGCPAERLDFAKVSTLTFEAPDEVRFPALRLAREALRTGGGAPVVLNAANEVAVQAFLDGRIGFLDIAAIVETCLDRVNAGGAVDLEEVAMADQASRAEARRQVESRAAAR